MATNNTLEHEFSTTPLDGSLPGPGVRLHYLDWGGDSTPTLLFVHGFGLTAHTWDVVCDLLHVQNRCIAIDQRGHGDSEWSPDGAYPIEHRVADLESVADQLLGETPCVLVGHSLGGNVSLRYAGLHPERLVGLVIVDTGPRVRQRSGNNRVRNFAMDSPVADSVEDFVERSMAFNPRRDRERLRRSLLFNLRQTPEGKWTWKYDRRLAGGGAAAQTPEEFGRAQSELVGIAQRIDLPTLVVHGDESDVYAAEDAEAFTRHLARGRLVGIPGAGHTVQGDQPYALAAALRTFVDEDVPRVVR
jgi:pimeloyl-ACP methyl ester carboxylesterase